MVLHAITQMASNGWRAFLWRSHIRWRPVAIYLIGCALALAAWSITRYVPDKPIALLLLGVTPFMARLTPSGLKPNPESIWQGTFYGSICMGLMLMTGVSGPLMDTFFLGGKFGRREVVATKATCQVASHFVKLVYFGGIIDQAATLDPALAVVAVAASMTGTTLARRFLEAMTDLQFRTWAGRLITTVAGYYILYGSWLLLARTASSFLLTEGGNPMSDPADPLVLDLVEWVAREPRLYSEVIEAWRTSCPRLTIWEDAVDRGYVARAARSRHRRARGDHRRAAKNSCVITVASVDQWPGKRSGRAQWLRITFARREANAIDFACPLRCNIHAFASTLRCMQFISGRNAL